MLLGQILFMLAAFAIGGATLIGVVFGVGKLVLYKLTGRRLGPKPLMGSSEWMQHESSGSVDIGRRSLLTERSAATPDDPIVDLDGDRYRVTRLAGGRFLITQVTEGRRVGTFELTGEGRHQDVLPAPDDPANAKLLVQMRLLIGKSGSSSRPAASSAAPAPAMKRTARPGARRKASAASTPNSTFAVAGSEESSPSGS